jgi:lipopolysaccharide O-acetyltransferase
VVISDGGWLAAYSLEGAGGDGEKPKIVIGDNVRIGPSVMITAVRQVSIGSGCLFSRDVFISDHVHGTQAGSLPPHRQNLVFKGAVEIGRNCFIGIRVAIMPGVTLGDNCVVGANAVVTRSFPANTILAGVPARAIGVNNSEATEESIREQ